MSLSYIARIQPHAQHLQAARDAIARIIPATLEEAGCERFELYEGTDGCLFLVEVWQDRAAFDAHHLQSYTRAVFEQYEAWLAAPVSLTEVKRI